jgi:putative two-component system response regulator
MNAADCRILIVDDEPANIVLLQRMLGVAGYSNLITANGASRAEELIKERNLDLVLLDLHMPEVDGFDVLRALPRMLDRTDYLPILVLTADATKVAKETALALGARDFLTKPFDNTEVLLRVRNLLETRLLHLELATHNQKLEDEVRKRTTELSQAVRRLKETEADLRASRGETVTKLAIAAEFRDDETAKHIHRMSRYCKLLARGTGANEERSELIRLASSMHDIGKIGISDTVLLKPGKLTPAERVHVERHAEIGHQILTCSKSELLQLAATIALAHHERIDGTGYPRGLSGTDIPFEARIAAIADVFDALTTDRVYRKAFHLGEALRILHNGRGTHFDSDLFDLFVDSIDDVLAIRETHAEMESHNISSKQAV